MIRQPGVALLLLLSLMAAQVLVTHVGATQAEAAEPFYLGRWRIVSAVAAPWAGTVDPAALAQARSRVGEVLTFRPDAVDGLAPLACAHPHYLVTGATARTLFDEKLDHVTLPADARVEDRDASGDYYSSTVLAERLGFRGFSWKALATRCQPDFHVFFPTPAEAMFAVDDIVVTMARQ